MSSNQDDNKDDGTGMQQEGSTSERSSGIRAIISQIEGKDSSQQASSNQHQDSVSHLARRGTNPMDQDRYMSLENRQEESGDRQTLEADSSEEEDAKGDIYVIPSFKIQHPVPLKGPPQFPSKPTYNFRLETKENTVSLTEGGSTNNQAAEGGSTIIQTSEGDSTDIQAPEGGSINIQAPEGGSTNIQASEGGSTNIQAPEGGSTNIQASEGSSTDIQAPEGGSTNIQAPEGGSTNIKAPEGDITSIQASEGESINIQASEGGSTNIQASEGGSTNIQASEGGSTNIQAPEDVKPNIQAPEGKSTSIQAPEDVNTNKPFPDRGRTNMQSSENADQKTVETERSPNKPTLNPFFGRKPLKFMVDGGSFHEQSSSADKVFPKQFNEEAKAQDLNISTEAVSSQVVKEEKRKSIKDMVNMFEKSEQKEPAPKARIRKSLSPDTKIPLTKEQNSERSIKPNSKSLSSENSSFMFIRGKETSPTLVSSNDKTPALTSRLSSPKEYITSESHPLSNKNDIDKEEEEDYETAEEDQDDDDLEDSTGKSAGKVEEAAVTSTKSTIADEEAELTSSQGESNNRLPHTKSDTSDEMMTFSQNQIPAEQDHQQPVILEESQRTENQNTRLQQHIVTPGTETARQTLVGTDHGHDIIHTEGVLPQKEKQDWHRDIPPTEGESQHVEQQGWYGETHITEGVSQQIEQQGGHGNTPAAEGVSQQMEQLGGYGDTREKAQNEQPDYISPDVPHGHLPYDKPDAGQPIYAGSYGRQEEEKFHPQPVFGSNFQGQLIQPSHSESETNQTPLHQDQPFQTPVSQGQPTQTPVSQVYPTQPPYSQGQPFQSPYYQGQPSLPTHVKDQPTEPLHSQGQPDEQPYYQGQGEHSLPTYFQGQPTETPHSQGHSIEQPYYQSQGQPSLPPHFQGHPPEQRYYEGQGQPSLPPQFQGQPTETPHFQGHPTEQQQYWYARGYAGYYGNIQSPYPHQMYDPQYYHMYGQHMGEQPHREDHLPQGHERGSEVPQVKQQQQAVPAPKREQEKLRGKASKQVAKEVQRQKKSNAPSHDHTPPKTEKSKKKEVAKPKNPDKKSYVCVKGLAIKTSLDSLCMYLENKSDCDVDRSSICFTSDKTMAVVTLLQTPKGFEEFKTKCQKKPLEGATIKICSVPAPVKIIVSSEQQLPAEDELKEHFQHKNYGEVKVKKVKMTDDGCCTVEFKDNKALENVCHSPYPHKIGGTSLCVTALYECEFGEIWEEERHKVCIPEDMELKHDDHHKMKLVRNLKNVSSHLDLKLKQNHAKLKVTDKLHVECTMDQKTKDIRCLVKVWESDILKIWNEFINVTVQQKNMSVTLEVWDELIDHVKEHQEHTTVLLDFKEHKGNIKLVIVGFDSMFNSVTDNINQRRDAIEKAIERKKQITSKTKHFKPIEIRLFDRLGILKQVNGLVTDLKVTGDEESSTITFNGVMDDILTAQIILDDRKEQLCLWTIQEDNTMSRDQVRLLQNSEILDVLEDKFAKCKLTVELDCLGDTVEIGTESTDVAESVKKIINETLLYTNLPQNDKEKIEVLDTGPWRSQCRQIQENHSGLVIISTEKGYGFTLASIESVHHDLLRELLEFIDDHAIYCDTYDIPDENKRRFFEKHYAQEIKEIASDLKSMSVTIVNKSRSLAVTGTCQGNKKAKERLKELETRIQTRQHDIQKHGITTVVSPDNSHMFSGIEDNTSTIIVQQDSMGQLNMGSQGSSSEDEDDLYGTEESQTYGRTGRTPSTGLTEMAVGLLPLPTFTPPVTKVQPVFTCKNGLKIKLRKGEIGTEKADVLVVSTSQDLKLTSGGAGKSLVKYGGPGLQAELQAKFPEKINHGTIVTIAPGKLQCKQVYLSNLPEWEKDRENKPMVITKLILDCLNKASVAGYSTVKFVAMGTGALKYPAQKAAELMYDAVEEFDTKGISSVLLVTFVLYSGDHRTISAFEDEEYKRIHPASQTGPRPPLDTKYGIKITLVKGLMDKQTVDVIACATSKTLDMGGGVATAVAKAVGPAIIQADCKAKYPSGIDFGDVAVVTNGNLRTCKAIYLTSLPGWKNQDGSKRNDAELNLNNTVIACLQKAAQLQMKSIAFPAFGTGQIGYPNDRVAKLMYNAVIDFASKNVGASVTDVRFVLHQKDWKTIMAFENEENTRKPSKPYSSAHKSFCTKANHLQVSIETCSIAEFTKADVIAATVSDDLDISKGKAMTALATKCGPTLKTECATKYPMGLKIGDLAEISPGNLSCKALYLGTLPSYNNGAAPAEKALDRYVRKVLETAASKGYTSVAFPAVGTGFNRYPHDRTATLCYEAVQHYDKKPGSIKVVYFVILEKDRSSLQAFQREERKRSSFPYGASNISTPSTSGAMGGATRSATGGTQLGRFTRVFSKKDEDFLPRPRRRTTGPGGQTHRQGQFATLPAASHVGLMSMRGGSTNQFLYGKVTLKVNVENIVKLKDPTDVIVYSTNKELDFTKGAVSKELMKVCNSKQLSDECEKLKSDMKSKGFICTSGCGLPYKAILHLDAQTSLKDWQKMIYACLQEVDKRGHTSVAFPALGTGGGSVQFKPEEIAKTFHETLLLFSGSNLTLVRLVIFDKTKLWNITKVFRDNVEKPSTSAAAFFDAVAGAGPGLSVDPHRLSLWILGTCDDNIDDAIQGIKDLIDRQYLSKKIQDTLVAQLNDNEVKEVKKLSKDYLITISVNKQTSAIELEGPMEEVDKAMNEIHKLITHYQMERHKDSEAEHYLRFVQWFYKEIDSQGMPVLSKYPPRNNMALENSRKGNHPKYRFWANDEECEVDLSMMKEYLVKDPTDCVDVIRREIQEDTAIELPADWDDMADPNVPVEVFPLASSSQKFKDIETDFTTSVMQGQYRNQFNASKLKVHKIERVQNQILYQQYAIRKDLLEKKNPQGTTNEQNLWHGTGEAAITSINYYGFNRSYCGGDQSKGACWFGNGVYFANDASYSARDWVSPPTPSKQKKMYLCRVLTGVCCDAQKGMRYLPPLPNNPSQNYDSAVHKHPSPHSTMEYVIYNDTQAYPEFLITFTTS
ncbi:uncharacterized protein [Argopecten irradians]|uniref:uncharacterized protein n=1 Tax=Argopecten irradians TaxID=31199 RepID=UPI00371544F8